MNAYFGYTAHCVNGTRSKMNPVINKGTCKKILKEAPGLLDNNSIVNFEYISASRNVRNPCTYVKMADL